jgi:hypothetical protein
MLPVSVRGRSEPWRFHTWVELSDEAAEQVADVVLGTTHPATLANALPGIPGALGTRGALSLSHEGPTFVADRSTPLGAEFAAAVCPSRVVEFLEAMASASQGAA